MQTFKDQIADIAQRKALSRKYHCKTPNLSFHGLRTDEQQELIQALIKEDADVQKYLADIITNAIADAYCEEIQPSEAIDDAIDLVRFAQEDAAQRARDMSLAARGY